MRGLNHGNLVHPAVLLADCLLERGPIGRVRTVHGEMTYQADPDALFRGWPIIVLVDFNTSGTAEWVAAALQDNRRAIVVGTPTMSSRTIPGNAVVTSTVPVGDGWSVNLVTGGLERGDGRPLSFFGRTLFPRMGSSERSQVGVHPDHAIDEDPRGRPRPSVPARRPTEEPKFASDPALQKAVELLRQPPKST
jgi:carboxyl-terminal processing protease